MCLVIVLCPTPTTFIYIIIYIYLLLQVASEPLSQDGGPDCCSPMTLQPPVPEREHFSASSSTHSYRRAPSKQSNSPQFITWAICVYIYTHFITYFITIHLTMTSSLHIITQNPSYAKHLNGHIRSQRNHMAQGMAPIASSSITSYRIRHLHLLQAIP